MRTVFRIATILSMLALVLGGQLCMVVTCAPASAGASHACCAAAAKKAARSADAPVHAGSRPCCIALALPHAPGLERPAAQDAHAAADGAAPALPAIAAPVAAVARTRPGDSASPPAGPPPTAARLRAPPIA